MAQCACGTEREVLRSTILRNVSRSCGCLHHELLSERLTRHGMSGTPEYAVWEAMIARCHNRNNKKFADYGGRGILVCPEWRDFVNFHRDMCPRPDGLTLDRIDNDGNYGPDNCRWATYSEQNANQRPTLVCRNGHVRTAENTLTCPDVAQGRDRIRCRDCDDVSRSRYVARLLSQGAAR